MQRYKKILITGGNSLLGTNVIKEFGERGIATRTIVRQSNPIIEGVEGCEVVIGNLMNNKELLEAAEGCDAIVHTAAITAQNLLHYSDYHDFNVNALSKVIEVARARGIQRVIFVSSSNTIGYGTKESLATENTPLQGCYTKLYYGRSKIEAERLLLGANDIEGVIVNPCFLLGRYDNKPSSGALIFMGYNKRVVITSRGGKNIVNVRSAAYAICNAVEMGKSGERYLLAGENILLKDFFRLLSTLDGKKKMIITLPNWLLLTIGYCGDIIRSMGIKTQISSINLRTICVREYYSGAKAKKDLKMPQSSVKGATKEAIEWFKRNSKLK